MLDEKTPGHLHNIADLSRQMPGDRSGMGPRDPSPVGDDAYRCQAAHMGYALSPAQYRHTPAFRDLWRDTKARLIETMMRWEVSGYRELTSRGSKVLDPDMNAPGEGWIDPVIRQTEMHSGHLLMRVGLHDMVCRDGRFGAPGSLTFRFRPVFRLMAPEDFPHEHGKLAGAILAEVARNDVPGCACAPNGFFVCCNPFPIPGCMHCDHTHGPRSCMPGRRTMSRWSVPPPGRHATDPMLAGVPIFGTLALVAAGVGDRETPGGLLARADRSLTATWMNGGSFSPRNDDLSGIGYATARACGWCSLRAGSSAPASTGLARDAARCRRDLRSPAGPAPTGLRDRRPSLRPRRARRRAAPAGGCAAPR